MRKFEVKFRRKVVQETTVKVNADNPKQANDFAFETVAARTADGEQDWKTVESGESSPRQYDSKEVTA